MSSLTQISRNTQQYLCMAMAAVIVAAGLSLGSFAADTAAHPGYSVTIAQL